jgi:hypothetical protein
VGCFLFVCLFVTQLLSLARGKRAEELRGDDSRGEKEEQCHSEHLTAEGSGKGF